MSDLPLRARLFIAAAMLAIVGFAAWITVRLLQVDGRALAIVLIALSYIGAVVVAIAVVTLTRIAWSLRAMPYLLGRGLRRLLTGR